jgi:hypothetical protein
MSLERRREKKIKRILAKDTNINAKELRKKEKK